MNWIRFSEKRPETSDGPFLVVDLTAGKTMKDAYYFGGCPTEDELYEYHLCGLDLPTSGFGFCDVYYGEFADIYGKGDVYFEEEPGEKALDGIYYINANEVVNEIIIQFISSMRKDVLSELPSAQRWIPVSERLPEARSGEVCVTVLDEYGDAAYTYSSVGFYLSDDCWIVDNEPMYADDSIRVIAWMPLPEPYEKEDSEKK